MRKIALFIPILILSYIFFTGQSDQISNMDNDDLPGGKKIYQMKDGGGIVAVNPPRMVFQSPNRQYRFAEAFTHPTNPNIFFAASVTDLGIGAYATTNGGVTWTGSDTLSGQGNFSGYFKPSISSSGDFYLGLARDLLRSSNNGSTWTYAASPPQLGHSSFSIDNNPSSPYYGRMYHVGQGGGSNLIANATFSTNSGVTWDTLHGINVPIIYYNIHPEGFDLEIGPEGNVYVCFAEVEYDVPFDGPSYIVEKTWTVSRSTNGGVDWEGPLRIFINGVGRKFFLGNTIYKLNSYPKIAVDKSGGSRNGWVYMTGTEREGSIAQDSADIVLRRSTDNGVSFPFQTRVNQDTPGNKKYQYIPAIKVDPYGGINIIYYDSRESSREDSVKVYMSRSVDGGVTWTDFPISERVFQPIESGQEIHSLGITQSGNQLWPFWTSMESGMVKLWTAPVEIGPVIVHDKIGDSENLSGPYTVNASILENNSSINGSETKVFWSRNGGALTNSITMTNTGGNNWSANIPGNGSSAEYRYYITTQDALGRVSTSPYGAPVGYNTFFAAPDTTPPMIEYEQLDDKVALEDLPFYIDLDVNENAYIDSVYVRLYKNEQTTPTHVLLQNLGGNRYAGQLIGSGGAVVGDSIRYKIYAVDNSGAGNVDSTGLYKVTVYDIPFYETFPLAGTGGEYWSSTRWTSSGAYIYHRQYINMAFRFPSEPALGFFDSQAFSTLNPLSLGTSQDTKLTLSFYLYWGHTQMANDSLLITYKDTSNNWKPLASIPGPFNSFGGAPYPPVSIEFPPDVNVSNFQFKLRASNSSQYGFVIFDDIKVLREKRNDEIALSDNFSFPFLNQGSWNQTSGNFKVINKDSAIGGTYPFAVPSEPYFLSIRGDGILESRSRDLSGFTTATLFMKQSEHDLEPGETVHVEFFDQTRAWQPLFDLNGSDNNSFVPFTDKVFILPTAALHSEFKLRFRSEGLEADDEWFIDNIFINQGTFTGNELTQNTIPERFALYQNYPNPFNPTTRINFDIPRQSFVKLKVYDILGREVSTLINSEYPPGTHSFDFNGSNLASGVYFYRLEAGDFVQIKKMVLIK